MCTPPKEAYCVGCTHRADGRALTRQTSCQICQTLWLWWFTSLHLMSWSKKGSKGPQEWVRKMYPWAACGEIIEFFELESTLKGPLVQLPCSDKEHQQLDQGVENSVQPDLEYLQGWNIHHLMFQCLSNTGRQWVAAHSWHWAIQFGLEEHWRVGLVKCCYFVNWFCKISFMFLLSWSLVCIESV